MSVRPPRESRLPLRFSRLPLRSRPSQEGRSAGVKLLRVETEMKLDAPDNQSGARAGLYAGLILLSSFGIFIFTRITIPDAMVCLWLTLAIFCYWQTDQQAQPGGLPCYGFAVCCALNVLTKGLIGIVFPIGIVLLHLLLTRGIRGTITRLQQFHIVDSLVVFFAVAAPWHVLIGLANPTQGNPGSITFSHGHWIVPQPTEGNVHGWTWFYFINEHLLRYLNLRVPRDYDTVPLLLFWGLLLVWLMPWSAFVFHAVAQIELRAAVAASPLFAGVEVAAVAAQSRAAGGVSRSSREHRTAARDLGGAADALLFVFDATGVLRSSCDASPDSADRGMALAGGRRG